MSSIDGKPTLPADVKPVPRKLADGSTKTYYYHRDTKRAIKGEPGTREFMLSYQAARRVALSASASTDRTIKSLIISYMNSPEWARLSKASKDYRRSYFNKIDVKFGTAKLDFFGHEEIVPILYDWRDEITAAVSAITADRTMESFAYLIGWAKKRREIRINWVDEIEPADNQQRRRSRANLVWEPQLWDTLLKAAKPAEERFLKFADFSVAREGDITRMRWSMYDGKWLVFKPQKTANKTGVEVHLPVYAWPAFHAFVESLPRTSELMLITTTGMPWTVAHWKQRFADLKIRAFGSEEAAKAINRHFHDVRGTGISRFQDAGCTEAEVCSVDGHVIGGRNEVGSYTNRSRRLALNAYEKVAAYTTREISDNVTPFRPRSV